MRIKSADRFWESVVGPLRRAMGFSVPPPAELEAELDAMDAEPMPESDVREIVEAVMKCRLCDHCGEMAPYFEPRWLTLHGDGCMWHMCPTCKKAYLARNETLKQTTD